MTDASALDADIRWDNLKKENSMDLSYATQFSVDYYTGGYKLISICDIGDYCLYRMVRIYRRDFLRILH